MNIDWKTYSIVGGSLLLIITLFFLEKVFFFFVITIAALLLAVILGLFPPLKYAGLELVTSSTILVGIIYGPVLGGIYGFTMLLAHLVIGQYYIGPYLTWVLPEFILLGIFSGIFKGSMIGPVGVAFVIGINLISMLFTFLVEKDRVGKELPYVIGNVMINSFLITQAFTPIINWIN